MQNHTLQAIACPEAGQAQPKRERWVKEKMKNRCIIFALLMSMLAGCAHQGTLAPSHASVRIQNNANVKVSWVSIGKKPYKSDFGILGSKGADKGAVVPVSYAKNFPIQWREGPYETGIDRYSEIDLSEMKGISRITIFYQGNGTWEVKAGDGTGESELAPSLKNPSNQ